MNSYVHILSKPDLSSASSNSGRRAVIVGKFGNDSAEGLGGVVAGVLRFLEKLFEARN
jgi:hypothetical protein